MKWRRDSMQTASIEHSIHVHRYFCLACNADCFRTLSSLWYCAVGRLWSVVTYICHQSLTQSAAVYRESTLPCTSHRWLSRMSVAEAKQLKSTWIFCKTIERRRLLYSVPINEVDIGARSSVSNCSAAAQVIKMTLMLQPEVDKDCCDGETQYSLHWMFLLLAVMRNATCKDV